ncbi:regulator of telomere elongation helicase 1-like protein [Sarcoptes scabiei]|uniref:Regulator of telomere elongation helicase 1-like protein n=1 Tax=Sarcoptes scabiei TaxID=52283 RepID=A0A132A6N3_SARSC|nr:regulator of telomere elongation helicase 1-like protein [Sarcoptes scabiei]
MRSVINALQKKQNALLESPTGTGKTLSLLCSTLAWLDTKKFQDLDSLKIVDKEKIITADDLIVSDTPNPSKGKKIKNKGKAWKNENPIRIIYSSRTHSQLNQACNELKRSYYKFCPTVTIGSRDQLCINPEVTNLETISAKNQTCRYKVKNNLCKFHHNYEKKVSDLSFAGSKIYDIEDLIQFGNSHQACPYYMSKALTDFNTSLTFMPYNYVLDPSIRKTLKLNLENCVIIFDEGHNIERVCEDSMSTELKSEWLALFIKAFDTTLIALKELDEGKYQGTNDKDLMDLNIHDVAKVKMTACDLEIELDNLARKDLTTSSRAHDTLEIFTIMQKINLDYERCSLITSVCDKINAFVMNSTVSFMTNQTIAALASVCSFLEILMPFSSMKPNEISDYKKEFARNYKLYTEIEQENNGYKKTWLKTPQQVTGWTVFLWCMSPSVAIKSLQRNGIYNLLITSGTLAPLESFECEMGIPFQIKLQNSHVISRHQLTIQLISKDPSGHELCGSYDKRNDTKYYTGLGYTVLEMARTVPKGVFIFFSSYSLINRCLEIWKDKKIWTLISTSKKIFVEPRNKQEFNENIQSFRYACDKTKEGAIFMGVSRGKLSEGIDLGDDYCRAVIIIGLPYPARYDPKVVLKQQYLNENNSRLNGTQWYMLQMKRALNQSIGRIIRHRNDYGLIVLCDSRFRQLNDGFSKWIVPFFKQTNENKDFKTIMKQIGQFFTLCRSISFESSSQTSTLSESSPDENCYKRSSQPSSQQSALMSNNAYDADIQCVFDSMRNNFTAIKEKHPILENSTKKKQCDSVFDALNDNDRLMAKRKQTFQRSNLNEEMDSKKFCPLSERPSSQQSQTSQSIPIESNSNKIRLSKYFQKNSEPFSIDIKMILDENEEENGDRKKQSDSPKEKIDLETDEIKQIKKNVFKTEKNIETFHRLIDHVSF